MSKPRKTVGFSGASRRDWVNHSVFNVDSHDWAASQNGVADDEGIDEGWPI